MDKRWRTAVVLVTMAGGILPGAALLGLWWLTQHGRHSPC